MNALDGIRSKLSPERNARIEARVNEREKEIRAFNYGYNNPTHLCPDEFMDEFYPQFEAGQTKAFKELDRGIYVNRTNS